MKLIANKQLRGDYGTVSQGQSFDVQPDVAMDLVRRGAAQIAPAVVYENKATEVAARLEFQGYVSVSNQEPQRVATESDSVLPSPDVSGRGTVDSGVRNFGKRFNPGKR